MITEVPDITRLLARMKAQKLIRQHRDKHDRRVVWTNISDIGLELLRQMDPEILQAPKDLLGHLKGAELRELIRLLEAARKNCGDTRAPVSCSGTSDTDQTCTVESGAVGHK
jgi:DNA-binding MarR family transcriptional regulator